MVSLKINGRKIKAAKGATVLQAAADAGIDIPHLCDFDGISPYGACRVCTVEVTRDGRKLLQAACTFPVESGIEIQTDSPEVNKGRKIILQFLLARCPDAKEIKQLAKKLGVSRSRSITSKEKDNCVLCGLCVRACNEVVGKESIGFSGRGINRKVDTPFGQQPENCIGCGLCTYVCPTGKIQMEAKKADRLRSPVGTERTCRYMLMGIVSAKTCPENIDCRQCPYDQSMEFTAGTHPALASPPVDASGPIKDGPFSLSQDRSYAKNHTWVKPAGKFLMVGVDDFFSNLFGPVDDVSVANGHIQLVSGQRKVKLALAVKGKVVKVNPDIMAVPRIVDFSPYDRGWIAMVKPKGDDADRLMSGNKAAEWFHDDTARLKKLGYGKGKKKAPAWSRIKKAFFERKV